MSEPHTNNAYVTSLMSARERLLKMLLEYGHWRRWIVCCVEEDADQDEMEMGKDEIEFYLFIFWLVLKT